jgi:hypothetical protein
MLWVGNIVSGKGLEPDPSKVKAIEEMKPPQDKSAVKSLQARTQFLREYVPQTAEFMVPITDLLRDKNAFVWDTPQEEAFNKLKRILTSHPVLVLYDPNKEHRICSDASNFALGATIEQFEQDKWKPVAYISRRLNDTEGRYAIIEKEALGILWSCLKFQDFVLGKKFKVVTDHKPLVSILKIKPLDELSPRLQRIRMKLMRFSYDIVYLPGKDHHLPDLLSRNPVEEIQSPAMKEELDIGAIEILRVSDPLLQEVLQAQKSDETCKSLAKYIKEGFPHNTHKLNKEMKVYVTLQNDLTVQDKLILYNNRVIVPMAAIKLREKILRKLHEGHQGICKMRARARQTVYWTGLSTEVVYQVENCRVCCENQLQRREKLMQTPMPQHPWQVIAMDIAELNGDNYLVIVDYYSKYPVVHLLENMTSTAIINKCKETFSMFGIPTEVRMDNARNFTSMEFIEFAEEYGFTQVTSSPYYPQSNGQAEAAVKIVKNIIKKSADPYLGLLAYRNTPFAETQLSPAQLNLGRQLRTTVPAWGGRLNTKEPDLRMLKKAIKKRGQRQQTNYDSYHGVRTASELLIDQQVFLPDKNLKGRVVRVADTPRSYWIATAKGEYRRNRSQIRPFPNSLADSPVRLDNTSPPLPGLTTTPPRATVLPPGTPTITRLGRVIRTPRRLNL